MPNTSVVTLSDSECFDESLARRIDTISRLSRLAAPVICLPDVHLKRGMEAPSSLATAIEGGIVPGLSSCSLNCGMGALKTEIQAADLTPARIRDFFDAFRRSAKASDWDLAEEEVLAVASRGLPAVSRKYGFADVSERNVEAGGTFGAPLPIETVEDLLHGTPPTLLKQWQTRLGLGIGGNHFVEVQQVIRIHDAAAAARLGLSQGAVLVMYHGGGGPLAGFVGRYFGNRTKDSSRKRARLFVSKVRYHFGDPRAVRRMSSRLKYFSRNPFVAHGDESREGRRLLASIAVGMNYGYAYRLAIASRIARSLGEVFGESGKSELLSDLSHNSIRREHINGRAAWIHRHNSCWVDAGPPLLLPGMYNSTSFVAVADEGADRFLRSAPHGLGELVSRDQSEKTARPAPGRTLRFDGLSREFGSVPHVSSPRMLAAIDRMENERLLRRVVELSPLGVLKNFRG